MDEILRLIYDYSKNGKLIDVDDLNLILEYYKKTLMLEDYILDFKVLDYPTSKSKLGAIKGMYFSKTKIIEIYVGNIQESINRNIEIFPWINYFLYNNIYTLVTLFHEIDHAYQNKLRYLNKSNLKTLLLKENILIKDSSELYKTLPKERMAKISSLLEAINIFNYLKKMTLKGETVKSFLKWDLEYFLFLGYRDMSMKYCCPSHEFLSKKGSIKLWESFDFYDEDPIALRRNVINQYSLEERLFLGLPIEPKEEKEISAIASSKFITPKRTLFKQPTIKEHFIL